MSVIDEGDIDDAIWESRKTGRCPKLEARILAQPFGRLANILEYASIHGRWVEAEPYIINNSYDRLYEYQQRILKGARWPEAEHKILQDHPPILNKRAIDYLKSIDWGDPVNDKQFSVDLIFYLQKYLEEKSDEEGEDEEDE